MANVSGGKSDFVQEGDSISDKVIPQLKSSIYPSLNSIKVHLEGEGNDAFEVSPFPIPNINANGSSMIFLRTKKQNDKNEIFIADCCWCMKLSLVSLNRNGDRICKN